MENVHIETQFPFENLFNKYTQKKNYKFNLYWLVHPNTVGV